MKKIFCFLLTGLMLLGLSMPSFAASGTIYCWCCGKKIPADSNYCSYCAAKQKTSSSSATYDFGSSYSSYSGEYDFLNLLPSNPVTHYGEELKKTLTNSRYYLTDEEKAGVDGETYRYRKDSNGNYRTGHRSAFVEDSSFGYPISFYYADGLVYFAIVYTQNRKEMVKLHYWGNQIIAFRDYRGNDHDLKYTDDITYSSIARDFADVFDIGMGKMK